VIDITRRHEWGARAPACGPTFNDWPVGVDLWVHHTAGSAPNGELDEEREMRGVQNFHIDTRGWCDIGYNYAVSPDGEVFEGRGLNVHGAHSPGKNHEPAVALLGNYMTVVPTDAQHRAVYDLLDELDGGDLRGHRENTQTTCPGDAAFAKIVKGPPPDHVPTKARAVFYWEEFPHNDPDNPGTGPAVVGKAAGYTQKAQAYVTAFRNRALGRTVTIVRDGERSFVLWWAKGTHGQQYRSKPFRTVAERDSNRNVRERLTGRKMRDFKGRQNSAYPYASPKES